MKKLLLVTLMGICPSMHATILPCLGLDIVISTSTTLVAQGAATLLSQAGQAGTYVGATIGGYMGSATGVAFGSEIGSEVGRRFVETAGQNVQQLPQDQRLGIGAGLIAAGYIVAKYGTRIVIGV